MRFLVLLCASLTAAAAQIPAAEAAYAGGLYAASDSLYTAAFESVSDTEAPSKWDYYNAACSAALAGHTDRAFARLGAAAVAGFENLGHARTDPDLVTVRADAVRWQTFETAVETSMAARYGPRYDPALRAELAAIQVTDQAGRGQFQALQARPPGAERDSLIAAMWAQQAAVDSLNLVRVEEIIAERGWPGFSVAGRDGSTAAWLVVQHAPIEAQQRYLPLMQAAVEAGDAEPSEFALLADRVRVRTDRPQLYGSQVRTNTETGESEFFPIEDVANVDARRASVGLGPLAEYGSHFGITSMPTD